MRLNRAVILLGLATFAGCKGLRPCDRVPPPSISTIAPAAPLSPPPVGSAPATLLPTDPYAPRLQPTPLPVKPSSLTAWGHR